MARRVVRKDAFIKGTNNVIDLVLTEDGSPIGVPPYTELEIIIGPVSIVRAADGNGVSMSAGVVSINPGLLTEDLSALVAGSEYEVRVRVTTATNVQGVVFGDNDTEAMVFLISNPA